MISPSRSVSQGFTRGSAFKLVSIPIRPRDVMPVDLYEPSDESMSIRTRAQVDCYSENLAGIIGKRGIIGARTRENSSLQLKFTSVGNGTRIYNGFDSRNVGLCQVQDRFPKSSTFGNGVREGIDSKKKSGILW